MLEIPKLPIQAASPNNSAKTNNANLQTRPQSVAKTNTPQSTSNDTIKKTSNRASSVEDKAPDNPTKESFSRTLERQMAHTEIQEKPAADPTLTIELGASKLLAEMRDFSSVASNSAEQNLTEKTVIPDNLSGLLPTTPQGIPASPITNNAEMDGTAEAKPDLLAEKSASNTKSPQNTLQTPTAKDDKLAKPAEPANISETALPASRKTAEFAVTTSQIANTLQSQSQHVETVKAETSFENMLAAVQTAHLQRNNEISTAAHTSTTTAMNTPLNQSGWNNEVADKVVWMVGRQEQRAELVINPPQFGRIEITLSINNDQTTAQFFSANPAVRETLESALPHLREILANAGISLGQAQVGAESQQNQAQQSANNRENRDNSAHSTTTEDLTRSTHLLNQIGTSQWGRQGNSLVDVFA